MYKQVVIQSDIVEKHLFQYIVAFSIYYVFKKYFCFEVEENLF